MSEQGLGEVIAKVKDGFVGVYRSMLPDKPLVSTPSDLTPQNVAGTIEKQLSNAVLERSGRDPYANGFDAVLLLRCGLSSPSDIFRNKDPFEDEKARRLYLTAKNILHNLVRAGVLRCEHKLENGTRTSPKERDRFFVTNTQRLHSLAVGETTLEQLVEKQKPEAEKR